ncbi:MAG: HNH endonuclease [Chloroflexi bacterium]|nr:HNH endonuclease [Chloroflexota bacterium]
MTTRTPWTRQQLLAAFEIYCCRLNFGSFHSRNPEIVRFASSIGRSPSALAMKLSNIASLDPLITSTGRVGLKSASAADRAMWEEMTQDWDSFSLLLKENLDSLGLAENSDPVNSTEEPFDNPQLGVDRPITSTARVGQRFFRTAVLSAYEQRCCISGLAIPGLLVASHIVPWRIDLANRVNPHNGLLLSALHDRAFDTGLFTIEKNMTVKVSRECPQDEFYSSAIFAFHGKRISSPLKFAPDPEFLKYHRDNIYIG